MATQFSEKTRKIYVQFLRFDARIYQNKNANQIRSFAQVAADKIFPFIARRF